MSESMSECVPEDDPEPPSGGIQEFIQQSIIDAGRFTDDGLAADYREAELVQREIEYAKQERDNVGTLTVAADALFQIYTAVAQTDDTTISIDEMVTLRRRREQIPESKDHPSGTNTLYFFNDYRVEGGYCRAWSQSSTRINWCVNESRHEPALEVLTHLNEAFLVPKPVVAESLLRRMAAPALRRLSRQNA